MIVYDSGATNCVSKIIPTNTIIREKEHAISLPFKMSDQLVAMLVAEQSGVYPTYVSFEM